MVGVKYGREGSGSFAKWGAVWVGEGEGEAWGEGGAEGERLTLYHLFLLPPPLLTFLPSLQDHPSVTHSSGRQYLTPLSHYSYLSPSLTR